MSKMTVQKKTYILSFVCMTTKAVHLEIVGHLTKEDCILSLKDSVLGMVYLKKFEVTMEAIS